MVINEKWKFSRNENSDIIIMYSLLIRQVTCPGSRSSGLEGDLSTEEEVTPGEVSKQIASQIDYWGGPEQKICTQHKLIANRSVYFSIEIHCAGVVICVRIGLR